MHHPHHHNHPSSKAAIFQDLQGLGGRPSLLEFGQKGVTEHTSKDEEMQDTTSRSPHSAKGAIKSFHFLGPSEALCKLKPKDSGDLGRCQETGLWEPKGRTALGSRAWGQAYLCG